MAGQGDGPPQRSAVPADTDTRSSLLRRPSSFENLHEGLLAQRTPRRTDWSANSTSFSKGWTSSWSSIQGLASNVLKDVASQKKRPALKRQDSDPKVRHTTSHYTKDRKYSSKPVSKDWGVPVQPGGDSGTLSFASLKPTRDDLLKAKKRDELLLGTRQPDNRYHKRCGSDEQRNVARRGSSLGPEGNRDTLVYLHHLQQSDTLAGILISYNCSATDFRRANRMGVNDNVQSRRIVFLPVNACRIRSRPYTDAVALGDDSADARVVCLPSSSKHQVSSESNGFLLAPSRPQESTDNDLPQPTISQSSPSLSTSSNHDTTASQTSYRENSLWQHEKFVYLPSFSDRVEIVRLPSSQISYFPPTRRKSLRSSGLNSPVTSLDLPRSAPGTPQISPADQSSVSSRRKPAHQRRNSAFLPTGPGGVGTLDRNTRTPGPAQDGLNRHVVPRLPKLMQPPSSTVDQESTHGGSSALFPFSDLPGPRGSRQNRRGTRRTGDEQHSIPLEDSPFNSSKGSFEDEHDQRPARLGGRTIGNQINNRPSVAAANAKILGDKALVGLESFGLAVGKGLEGFIRKATEAIEATTSATGTSTGSHADISRPLPKSSSGTDVSHRSEDLDLIELHESFDGELERADSSSTIRPVAGSGWSTARGGAVRSSSIVKDGRGMSQRRSRAGSGSGIENAGVRGRGRRVRAGDEED